LQRLANERIADARALLAAKRWSAAYYLAGYAVECALKACIAKRTRAEEFPDKTFADKCWTHNLLQLLGVAELKDDFQAAMKADPLLGRNWETVKDWSEASRYARIPMKKAKGFYKAIADKKHGVLSWVKFRW
jgi:HEPN domain-containing protein